MDTESPPDPFSETKERISGWLMADEWKLSRADAEQAAWGVLAEDAQGKKVIVAQLKNRPDLLVIQAAVTPGEEVQSKIERLETREELLWDIRFQLLNMGVKFHGIESPLARVETRLRLYVDDLRRNEFLQAIDRIQDSILAVLWTINRHLGRPGSRQDEMEALKVN